MLYISVYLLVCLNGDMNNAFIGCLVFQVLTFMRGVNENFHNLRLCHQIKEESVFAGTKTCVEMGNNNLTNKDIACPPTTFFFVVQSRKNRNDK